MIKILRSYLLGATSNEIFSEIEEADKTFQTFDIEDYDDHFENIIMDLDNLDAGEGVLRVIEATHHLQLDILRQHGIVPVDNLSMSRSTELIQALLAIQHHDDPAAILKIAYQTDTAEEIFAELVQLVRSTTAEEILTYVETVETGLITLIRELANQQEVGITHADNEETHAEHIASLRSFLDFIDTFDLIMMRPIKGGLSVGFPFSVYADIIGRDLEELAPERIAEEFIAMALISSDGYQKVREIVNSHIEQYIADANVIAKVTSIISTRLVEYGQYEKT